MRFAPDTLTVQADYRVLGNNANSRADKRQRNLGEYMLNNPGRP